MRFESLSNALLFKMNVLDEEDTSNLEQETYEGGDGEDSSDSENLPEASVGDVAATASNEPTEDQKREIARWIKEGMGLSDVQKRLDEEFSINMTYMDVRFLVDDLDLTLQDAEEPEPEKPSQPDEVSPDSEPAKADSDSLSSISVEGDKVTRPGSMASGTAIFSDGVNCPWYVDQFGRLGLMPKEEGYKPPEADLAEFQKQLDAELRKTGI